MNEAALAMEQMWCIHSQLDSGDITMITGTTSGVGVAQVRGLGRVGKSLVMIAMMQAAVTESIASLYPRPSVFEGSGTSQEVA